MPSARGMFPPPNRETPGLTGAIFIGGASSRMGQPKHLLRLDGESWLRRINRVLSAVCDQVVAVGRGAMDGMDLARIEDASGIRGPLAGLLAMLREAHGWVLVTACDLPLLSPAAACWLVEQRHRDADAVIPRCRGRDQPLLALYHPRLLPAVEAMCAAGESRMRALCRLPAVRRPVVPEGLASSWRNINTPDELARVAANRRVDVSEVVASRT